MSIDATQKESKTPAYFEPKRLLWISSACKVIANLFLILATLIFVLTIWLITQEIVRAWTYLDVPNLLISAFTFGLAALLCLFFWVILHAIAEGLFVLLDIQDNIKHLSR